MSIAELETDDMVIYNLYNLYLKQIKIKLVNY